MTETKAYDGNTTAQVIAGNLTGVADGDTVTVSAVAKYDNANVGTGKTITVEYTLAGAHAAKYAAPSKTVVTTGVITKATTPAAPATTFSFDGVNAGSLMGATTGMEFSLDGGTTWISIESNEPSILLYSITDTDDIKVRVGASSNTEVGEIQIIDITKAPTPNLTNHIASALNGIPNTVYQFSKNGTSWQGVTSDGDGKISLTKGTYSVRVKATGTVLASDAQTNVVSS